MARLDDAAVAARLGDIEGWTRVGREIRKTYRFDCFRDAVTFVDQVADLAEAADHHPDIDIRFDRVRLSLSTKSAGGLTDKDFDLATTIDAARRPKN